MVSIALAGASLGKSRTNEAFYGRMLGSYDVIAALAPPSADSGLVNVYYSVLIIAQPQYYNFRFTIKALRHDGAVVALSPSGSSSFYSGEGAYQVNLQTPGYYKNIYLQPASQYVYQQNASEMGWWTNGATPLEIRSAGRVNLPRWDLTTMSVARKIEGSCLGESDVRAFTHTGQALTPEPVVGADRPDILVVGKGQELVQDFAESTMRIPASERTVELDAAGTMAQVRAVKLQSTFDGSPDLDG